MSVRSASTLSYIVPVGGLTIVVASILWAIGDSSLLPALQDTWSASASSHARNGRDYVTSAYAYLPLIVLMRLGLETIVTARGTTVSAGGVILSTVALWTALVVMLMFVTVFPAPVDGLVNAAAGREATLSENGFYTLINTFHRAFIGWFPGLMCGAFILGYFVGPIKRDLAGGV